MDGKNNLEVTGSIRKLRKNVDPVPISNGGNVLVVTNVSTIIIHHKTTVPSASVKNKKFYFGHGRRHRSQKDRSITKYSDRQEEHER